MIVLKISPDDPATADADWTRTQDLITSLFLGANGNISRVIGTDIVKGSVFQIGGAIYYAESDTAITGSASDYVKITPSGSTASASYVSSLSGVTWNDTYNGWYDGSGNLYVFDEAKAVQAGEISEAKTKLGSIRCADIKHLRAGASIPTDDPSYDVIIGSNGLKVNGDISFPSQLVGGATTTSALVRGNNTGYLGLYGGVNAAGGAYITLAGNSYTAPGVVGIIAGTNASSNIQFYTNNPRIERMRINYSGRVLIGSSLPADESGYDLIVGSNGIKSNGTITTPSLIQFSGGDNQIRFLGGSTYRFRFSAGAGFEFRGNDMYIEGKCSPYTDNTYDLGSASYRWQDIYATNNIIQTSDGRQKSDKKLIEDIEIKIAIEMVKSIGTFQWLTEIDKKGKDKARHHIGIVAQEIEEIFKNYNVDPFKYGILCKSKTQNRKNDTIYDMQEEVYGIRTNEAIMFMLSGLIKKIESLEN